MDSWSNFFANNSDDRIIDYFDAHRRDIDKPDGNNEYALIVAASMLRTQLVSALLSMGANPDIVDECGDAPIHNAIEYANNDQSSALTICRLLIEMGANIELRGWMERTPLLKACHYGNLEITSFLLENGANPNAEADEWMNPGFNALDFSKMGKNEHVIYIVEQALASAG